MSEKPVFRYKKAIVVDDNPEIVAVHTALLEEMGFSVTGLTKPSGVDAYLHVHPDTVLAVLDIEMPELNGMDLLRQIKMRLPTIQVIMVTVLNKIDMAVEATKSGAYNYLLKPLHKERLREAVTGALSAMPQARLEHHFPDFITGCKRLAVEFDKIARFAQAGVTILIQGETGTGKEIIAQNIHRLSPRSHETFLPVNVASVAATVFESELFGHISGSFTGATRDRAGYLGHVGEGTLFLDEIGELSLEHQAKLLRLLQSKQYSRVGESKPRTFAGGFLMATHVDFKKAIAEGRFREDLYYRLAPYVITLPPLRERRGDIELLSAYFLNKAASQFGRHFSGGIEPDAMEVLKGYKYPGNVRELEGIISSAVLIETGNSITVNSLPEHLVAGEVGVGEDCDQSMQNQRDQHIISVLEECGGNQTRAAERLNISRQTVNRLIQKYRQQGLLPTA